MEENMNKQKDVKMIKYNINIFDNIENVIVKAKETLTKEELSLKCKIELIIITVDTLINMIGLSRADILKDIISYCDDMKEKYNYTDDELNDMLLEAIDTWEQNQD